MTVETTNIIFSTSGDCQIIEITDKIQQRIKEAGISDGAVVIFVPGATGAITTIEYESGLIKDFQDAWERWAPKGMRYQHDRRWHDGNGHSHIRASLLGPSLTVPFRKKELLLGTWQQIVFVDFDNRPRKREVILQIIGE